jgi:hypothetical protein
MPGFYDVVSQTWNRQVQTSLNPLTILHTKMRKTAKALRYWSKFLLPQSKIALTMCREVILQLETAQESRPLTHDECDFISKLKHKIMGLATIEKCWAKKNQELLG